VSGSTNSLTLVYGDNTGASITNSATFVTAGWVPLDPSWVVTGVDTNKPGFKVKPYQVTNASPNTIAWTEEMFKGQHGSNIADLTQNIGGSPIDTNGYYTVTGVVNWDKVSVTATDGNFRDNNGFPESELPGQPAGDGSGLYTNDGEEVLTFLQFPTAGLYTMGVNSDDGFAVTFGANPAIYPPGIVAGIFNGGRGASDTTFGIYVPTAGIYRARLLWENGGSGANCEWFTVQPDGSKILVNDLANANAIKAFYSGPPPSTNTPPPGTNIVISSATLAGGQITIHWTGGGTLQTAPNVNSATTGWADIPGANTGTYTAPATVGTAYYRVRSP